GGGRARARPETGRAHGDPRARARRTDPLAAGPRPPPLTRVRHRARGDRCARGGIARGAGCDPGEKVGSTVTTCESDRLPDGTRVSRSPCGEEAEDANLLSWIASSTRLNSSHVAISYAV